MKAMSVAIDFDGVLSHYSGDPSQPPGPPLLGARQFVEELLQQGVEVVIFSSRDQETIRQWLHTHDFPALPIFYKPPVVAIIDDRAIRFEGEFRGLRQQLWQPPWWKGTSGRER